LGYCDYFSELLKLPQWWFKRFTNVSQKRKIMKTNVSTKAKIGKLFLIPIIFTFTPPGIYVAVFVYLGIIFGLSRTSFIYFAQISYFLYFFMTLLAEYFFFVFLTFTFVMANKRMKKIVWGT
jgi:hypothetical protein